MGTCEEITTEKKALVPTIFNFSMSDLSLWALCFGQNESPQNTKRNPVI